MSVSEIIFFSEQNNLRHLYAGDRHVGLRPPRDDNVLVPRGFEQAKKNPPGIAAKRVLYGVP
jgi:hypothetical protein